MHRPFELSGPQVHTDQRGKKKSLKALVVSPSVFLPSFPFINQLKLGVMRMLLDSLGFHSCGSMLKCPCALHHLSRDNLKRSDPIVDLTSFPCFSATELCHIAFFFLSPSYV